MPRVACCRLREREQWAYENVAAFLCSYVYILFSCTAGMEGRQYMNELNGYGAGGGGEDEPKTLRYAKKLEGIRFH